MVLDKTSDPDPVKMIRTLWIALGLMACAILIQADSVQYTDCPKDCKCVKNLMASVMSCKALFTENLASALPITQFELTDAEGPITLTENIFEKMGLQHVNAISISNSNVVSIDKGAFSGLKELSHIEIINSKISKIDPDTFKEIPNLKTLKLAGNPLDKNTVIVSKNLEQLVIPNCDMSVISGKLFEHLPSVIFVDLSNNNIETLQTGVFDSLEVLQEVNLSHNKLKQIPKDLFKSNDVLNTLNLSYNPLISFSGDELDSIETLDLKSCLLKQIDGEMFKKLDSLQNLDLSENKITDIDGKAFEAMSELYAIDLSQNELRILNENIFVKNIDLQKIKLDNNLKLTKLPAFAAAGSPFAVHYFSCVNCNLHVLSKDTFKNMPGLVTLLLSNNKIYDVSTGVFQNLTNLIELDLSHNEIITIDDETLKYNTDLQKFSLSFNNLKALHASMFKENSNLKFLELSNCGLYQLWTAPTNKIQLNSVLSLNISNNNIKIITKDDIAVTSRLKSLDISTNPLSCNSDLKDLVDYLMKHEVKNTQYLTHEKQSFDFEEREKVLLSWKEIARTNCPDLLEEDAEDEDEEEDYEEDTEKDQWYDTDAETDLTSPRTVSKPAKNIATEIDVDDTEEDDDDDDDDEDDDDNDDIILAVKHKRYHYSYMWPVLVFVGTALVVLGLVANLILCVIRRRQSIAVPKIINVSKMSRLKKNSGLVYQQLSEEHGSKTPILARFAPVPSVHGYPNESEHV